MIGSKVTVTAEYVDSAYGWSCMGKGLSATFVEGLFKSTTHMCCCISENCSLIGNIWFPSWGWVWQQKLYCSTKMTRAHQYMWCLQGGHHQFLWVGLKTATQMLPATYGGSQNTWYWKLTPSIPAMALALHYCDWQRLDS